MKIGLIGNMNNNNFALMRYLRCLGEDAHLFLFSDDGVGDHQHFRPEFDTWEIDRWKPYIHRLSVPNSPIALLGIWGQLARKIFARSRHLSPDDYSAECSVEKVATEYDVLIGSGISPAIFRKCGRKLDIFFPCSMGVEFIDGSSIFGKNPSVSRRVLSWWGKRQQVKGVQEARLVINGDAGKTSEVLNAIGARHVSVAMPMVFNLDAKVIEETPNPAVAAAIDAIRGSDFSIMSHASLAWIESKRPQGRFSKHNDWLIYAFKKVVDSAQSRKVLLVLIEYGPDISETKALIEELKISKNVLWLPKLGRKEVMLLLDKVSVGVGEFIDLPKTLWGGTGWEVLAAGKPLLQGFKYGPREFEELYGYAPPKMLMVQTQDDVEKHLLQMLEDPWLCESIGLEAGEWFGRYNGIGLARQWLELATGSSPIDLKQSEALATTRRPQT